MYYNSLEFSTNLRQFTKNVKIQDLSIDALQGVDADTLWSRFKNGYGESYQIFEKLCTYIGRQFDPRVKDVTTAFQLGGGPRQPNDDQLRELLKTLVHYRNAVTHGHAEVSEEKIRLWDEYKDVINWSIIIEPVDPKVLFQPFIDIMGLLQGLEVTALELQLRFDAFVLRNAGP